MALSSSLARRRSRRPRRPTLDRNAGCGSGGQRLRIRSAPAPAGRERHPRSSPAAGCLQRASVSRSLTSVCMRWPAASSARHARALDLQRQVHGLDEAGQHRQRRADLVRDVGDEVAPHRLGCAASVMSATAPAFRPRHRAQQHRQQASPLLGSGSITTSAEARLQVGDEGRQRTRLVTRWRRSRGGIQPKWSARSGCTRRSGRSASSSTPLGEASMAARSGQPLPFLQPCSRSRRGARAVAEAPPDRPASRGACESVAQPCRAASAAGRRGGVEQGAPAPRRWRPGPQRPPTTVCRSRFET